MTIRSIGKLLVLILDLLITRLLAKKEIFHKLAMMSFLALTATLIPTLFEQVIDKFTDEAFSDCVCDTKGVPTTVFIAALFISLTFIFAFLSNKDPNSKEGLINSVKKETWALVNSNIIHTYTGSILQVSDIEVLVTSENTSLNLGSISGTSVSGRARRLAATYNSDGILFEDSLFKSIEQWKSDKESKGPYQRGVIILSPAFQAELKGVKSIVNAIAVEKNSKGEHLINEDAIRKIIESSIEHCKTNNYKSIFIPIFGLGSGGNDKNYAVKTTMDPLLEVLNKENLGLNVYIGVYRFTDLMLVSKSILKACV